MTWLLFVAGLLRLAAVGFSDGTQHRLAGQLDARQAASAPPDRSARIAVLVGAYQPGAERAEELADMVVEVIAGAEIVQPEG